MPDVPVTQCAAVTTRSPCGPPITLAVQKCRPSLPLDIVNRAPTAGVPAKSCPFCEVETMCRTARAKLEAMSPAAPSAGVTAATTPTVSTLTIATAAGAQGNHRARLRGPLSSPGRDSSPPGSRACRAARNRTCCRHLPRYVTNSATFGPRLIPNCDGQGATVPEVNLQSRSDRAGDSL